MQKQSDARLRMAQAINEVDAVTNVDKVQSSVADLVVHFDKEDGCQALRVEWLKNHRDAFEIVDYNRNGDKSYMQLKAK